MVLIIWIESILLILLLLVLIYVKKKEKLTSIRMTILAVMEDMIYLAEKLIIFGSLVVLIWWGCKIFILGVDVKNGIRFIEVCNKNWIGLLVFVPLLFYRIIIQKMQELSEISSAKFRKVKAKKIKNGDASSVEIE